MHVQGTITSLKRWHRWAIAFAILVILMAALVLWGWQFDVAWLKRPLPKLVAMNPLTAVSFLLTGLSALLLMKESGGKNYRVAGYSLAGMVILLPAVKIIQLITGSLHPVDQWLYPVKIKDDLFGNVSNSMAPNTAACFVLSGLGLCLLHYESPRKKMPGQYLALLVALAAFFSILGYTYQVLLITVS